MNGLETEIDLNQRMKLKDKLIQNNVLKFIATLNTLRNIYIY